MAITIELPKEIEQQLQAQWTDLARHALEGLVTEAFRQGKLSSHEVAQALGMGNRWEAIAFLSERGAYPGYDLEEIQEDRHAFESREAEDSIIVVLAMSSTTNLIPLCVLCLLTGGHRGESLLSARSGGRRHWQDCSAPQASCRLRNRPVLAPAQESCRNPAAGPAPRLP